MIFLEYPKCTTCQKARKWLDAHGVAYEDRHIKENNPTVVLLILLVQLFQTAGTRIANRLDKRK